MSMLAPVVPLNRSESCPNATVYVSAACPPEMARPNGVQWAVKDYDLMKQLYRGKASLLYKATCRHSNTTVALKLYRKHKLSSLNWYQVGREIQIHASLDHPHIIGLFGAFEDTKHVYLVQEFAPGGDLYEELKRVGGRFRERDTAVRVLAPALQALVHCHKRGIIHRDIKPENILLGQNRSLRLADFGLSVDHRKERPVTRCGTLEYMTPEVLGCPEKCHPEDNKECENLWYGSTVDAWAMGVLAFELITGKPPFERETRAATYEAIMYRRPPFPVWMTKEAQSFITMALNKDARKRPDVEDLLLHPFITDVLPPAQQQKTIPVTEIAAQPQPVAAPAFAAAATTAAGAAAAEAAAALMTPSRQEAVFISCFAAEAARCEGSNSSFQGGVLNLPKPDSVVASKSIPSQSIRPLSELQKSESVPDILGATREALRRDSSNLVTFGSVPYYQEAEVAHYRESLLSQASTWGPCLHQGSTTLGSRDGKPNKSQLPTLSTQMDQSCVLDLGPSAKSSASPNNADVSSVASIMSWAGSGVKSLVRVFSSGRDSGSESSTSACALQPPVNGTNKHHPSFESGNSCISTASSNGSDNDLTMGVAALALAQSPPAKLFLTSVPISVFAEHQRIMQSRPGVRVQEPSDPYSASSVTAESENSDNAVHFRETLRRLTPETEHMPGQSLPSRISLDKPPMHPASSELRRSVELRSSVELQTASGDAPPSGICVESCQTPKFQEALSPNPAAPKRKRFTGIRRALRAARPATARPASLPEATQLSRPSSANSFTTANPGLWQPDSSSTLLQSPNAIEDWSHQSSSSSQQGLSRFASRSSIARSSTSQRSSGGQTEAKSSEDQISLKAECTISSHCLNTPAYKLPNDAEGNEGDIKRPEKSAGPVRQKNSPSATNGGSKAGVDMHGGSNASSPVALLHQRSELNSDWSIASA